MAGRNDLPRRGGRHSRRLSSASASAGVHAGKSASPALSARRRRRPRAVPTILSLPAPAPAPVPAPFVLPQPAAPPALRRLGVLEDESGSTSDALEEKRNALERALSEAHPFYQLYIRATRPTEPFHPPSSPITSPPAPESESELESDFDHELEPDLDAQLSPTGPPHDSTSLVLPGQSMVTLHLRGRAWRSAPEPLRWCPTLDRSGIEKGDRLDRLRPVCDRLYRSLVPGLGLLPAPANEAWPATHRAFLADQIRASTRVPAAAREALASLVQDGPRALGETSILLSKPVWVVPLDCPLPAFLSDDETEAEQAQKTHAAPVVVVEPRVPQWCLLALPLAMLEMVLRSATYSPRIDALGNLLGDSTTSCAPATAIASSYAGLSVGGSQAALAAIDIQLAPQLGQPMAHGEVVQAEHAKMAALAEAERTGVHLPRSIIADGEGRKDNRGSAPPLLATGPFIQVGEEARWKTRILQTQLAEILLTKQTAMLDENHLLAQRAPLEKRQRELEKTEQQVAAKARAARDTLRHLQSSTEQLRVERDALRAQLECANERPVSQPVTSQAMEQHLLLLRRERDILRAQAQASAARAPRAEAFEREQAARPAAPTARRPLEEEIQDELADLLADSADAVMDDLPPRRTRRGRG